MQHNELVTFPSCLLELPSLKELNLSCNKLNRIPYVSNWSRYLSVLDLSENLLENLELPNDVLAPSLHTLNLSKNNLNKLPTCIGSFTNLHCLNISHNPYILSLPPEMGDLSNLKELNVDGLIDLSDPPLKIQKDTQECIQYLRNKLYSMHKLFRMKLVVVGEKDSGKTPLVARLQGHSDILPQSTIGIDVSEWYYKRRYHFSIWKLGGEINCRAVQQCFMSDNSMYLVVWNLAHFENAIKEIEVSLNTIATKAPQACVLIVGTIMDQVEKPILNEILHKVSELAMAYHDRLYIPESGILAVGLTDNIGVLQEAILTQALSFKGRDDSPLMGQDIPHDHFQLIKLVESLQEDVEKECRDPVTDVKQLKELVIDQKVLAMHKEYVFNKAIAFLNRAGVLLHSEDRINHLNDLCIVDPRWLFKVMSRIIESKDLAINAILQKKHLCSLLEDMRLPLEYFDGLLAFLDKFEMVFPLACSCCMLIPSLMSDKRPDNADICDNESLQLYSRYIILECSMPPGFWARFISKAMCLVKQIRLALNSILKHDSTNNSHSFFLHKNSSFMEEDTNKLVPQSNFEINFWTEGIVYKEPGLFFCVESLKSISTQQTGFVFKALPTKNSIQILFQLHDILLEVITERYPSLNKAWNTSDMQCSVPCYKCGCNLDSSDAFSFNINEFLSNISNSNCSFITCGHDENPNKNHQVNLVDIIPDYLFQDIDTHLLNSDDINYSDSIITNGTFGMAYQGIYKSKSIVVKKYSKFSLGESRALRTEVKMLERAHPCLVQLVGVLKCSCVCDAGLVFEEAPVGTLDDIIKKSTPLPRLVMFRITAQIAAALGFLHKQSIVFRELTTANVLIWSINPNALCHAKLKGSHNAIHVSSIGTVGIVESDIRFLAPEMYYVDDNGIRGTYNHKVDIFSLGMLLYQLIACRYPYYDVDPHNVSIKVYQGERPNISEIPLAAIGYYYLAYLMEECWKHEPHERPETSTVISFVSNITFQSLMCVYFDDVCPSLTQGCAVSPSDNIKTNSEMWICSTDPDGIKISVYEINRMVKMSKHSLKDKVVQCMCVCDNHVWICSKRSNTDHGIIDITKAVLQEIHVIHSLNLKNDYVTCITSSEDSVYVGTSRGYCYIFDKDIKFLVQEYKPIYCSVAYDAIDGIVVTDRHVWISHTRFVSFLNLLTLRCEHLYKRTHSMNSYIGQLSKSTYEDTNIIWSACVGGQVISAWIAKTGSHLYDIMVSDVLLREDGDNVHNTSIHLEDNSDGHLDRNKVVISCMTPVLDTVWVGMSTGHILVFHEQELMMHVRPYLQPVRFLIPIACQELCQFTVISSGDYFAPPLLEYAEKQLTFIGKSGVLILWEAYSATTLYQMKALHQKGPTYLDNFQTVGEMIRSLQFDDDTNILGNIPGMLDNEIPSTKDLVTIPRESKAESVESFSQQRHLQLYNEHGCYKNPSLSQTQLEKEPIKKNLQNIDKVDSQQSVTEALPNHKTVDIDVQ